MSTRFRPRRGRSASTACARFLLPLDEVAQESRQVQRDRWCGEAIDRLELSLFERTMEKRMPQSGSGGAGPGTQSSAVLLFQFAGDTTSRCRAGRPRRIAIDLT